MWKSHGRSCPLVDACWCPRWVAPHTALCAADLRPLLPVRHCAARRWLCQDGSLKCSPYESSTHLGLGHYFISRCWSPAILVQKTSNSYCVISHLRFHTLLSSKRRFSIVFGVLGFRGYFVNPSPSRSKPLWQPRHILPTQLVPSSQHKYGGRGISAGEIVGFQCQIGAEIYPTKFFCAARARPLLKVGQVPQFPKIWGCQNFLQMYTRHQNLGMPQPPPPLYLTDRSPDSHAVGASHRDVSNARCRLRQTAEPPPPSPPPAPAPCCRAAGQCSRVRQSPAPGKRPGLTGHGGVGLHCAECCADQLCFHVPHPQPHDRHRILVGTGMGQGSERGAPSRGTPRGRMPAPHGPSAQSHCVRVARLPSARAAHARARLCVGVDAGPSAQRVRVRRVAARCTAGASAVGSLRCRSPGTAI